MKSRHKDPQERENWKCQRRGNSAGRWKFKKKKNPPPAPFIRSHRRYYGNNGGSKPLSFVLSFFLFHFDCGWIGTQWHAVNNTTPKWEETLENRAQTCGQSFVFQPKSGAQFFSPPPIFIWMAVSNNFLAGPSEILLENKSKSERSSDSGE